MLVHWLESGASGHRLKLKLHFVDVDVNGKEVVDPYVGYESTVAIPAAAAAMVSSQRIEQTPRLK